MKRFNLTVEALSDHWEAFILPKLSLEKNVIFNSDNLKELESILVGKQAVEKKVVKETVKVKSGAKGGLESM